MLPPLPLHLPRHRRRFHDLPRSEPASSGEANRKRSGLPRLPSSRSIGTHQRHQHGADRELSFFGSPGQNTEIATGRVDMAAAFEDAGHHRRRILRPHDQAGILIGGWADIEHGSNDNRGRQQVTPTADGTARPVIDDLRAGLKNEAERE